MSSQNSSAASSEAEQRTVCPTVPVSHVTELLEPAPQIQRLFSPRSTPEETMLESFFDDSVVKMEKKKLSEDLFFALLPDIPLTRDHPDKTRPERQNTRVSSQNSSAGLPEPSLHIQSDPGGLSLLDELMLGRHCDDFAANDDSKVEEEKVVEELLFTLLPDVPRTPHKSSRDDADHTRQTAALSVCPAVPVGHKTEPLEPSQQIHNVISTARLGCQLDLNVIARNGWNVEYDPKVHKVLIMRIRKPRTTAMIYASGTVMCTGAKSEEQSRVAVRRYARIVQQLGFPVSVLNFKIKNIVATCNSCPVNLEQLLVAHPQHCSYEPELFPGLFYNVEPGVTVTIFASGKMSLSGAKSEADIYRLFDVTCSVVSSFRRS